MNNNFRAAAALLFVAALAACGGGGGTAGTPFPTLAPSSQAGAALSPTKTTVVQLPQINSGTSASVTLPATSGAANATLTLQPSLPTGAVAPQLRGPKAIGGGTVTGLAYILLTVDHTISIASTPAFSFSLLTPLPANTQAYIAFLDLGNTAAGWSVLDGPATANGTILTFASQSLAPPVTLKAGDTYVFALVTVTAAVATPTPPVTQSASYSGTKSVNFTYGFNFAYPQPSPTGSAPPVTLNYTVNTTVSAGASPFPGPSTSGLLDQHVAETDSTNLETTTYSTDSYLTNTGGAINLFGMQQLEPSSANQPLISTVYGTPQTLDQLPETNGGSWSNSPAATVSYAYASNDAGTRTIGANGTYADAEVMNGAKASMTENSDGSGTITGPFFGGGFIDSIVMSAPTPAPNASTPPLLTVTLNFDPFAQTNFGYPPNQVIYDPVWYPYTAGSPLTFYSEQDTVTTGVSLSTTKCAATQYTSANDVRRTITVLDTVLGDVETTQLDSYNVNGIPVCLVTNDVLNYAYDIQGNTPYLIYIGTSLGLQVVTTNEVLSLQNAPASQGRQSAAVAQQQQGFAAALQAHQLATFSRERATRTLQLIHRMRSAQGRSAMSIRGGIQ